MCKMLNILIKSAEKYLLLTVSQALCESLYLVFASLAFSPSSGELERPSSGELERSSSSGHGHFLCLLQGQTVYTE